MTFILVTLLVFSIPWEKSVVVPGLGTLTKLIGIAALLSGVVDVRRKRDLRAPNIVLVLASVFVIWSAVTWLWSLDRDATVTRTATYIQLLAMTWLVWQFCRTARQQRTLMSAYVAGAVIAALATIVRYSEGVQTYWQRYAAPGFDPNDLGVTVAIAVPIALYLSHWARWVVVIICAAILLTASRTALIATFAGFTIVLWTWRGATHMTRWSGVALAGLTVLGAVSLAPKESRARIATTTTEITRGTLHKRTTIWKAGLRSLKQYPLQGAGAGAYPDSVEPYIGVPPRAGHEYVAHNTFLSVLVETGAVGLSIYALMLLAMAAFVWVMPWREAALWFVVLVVWAIGASTLTWEHRKPTWLIAGLVMTQWARAFQQEPSE
jgi:O-antigen ligase